jgi:osmoprotectant transport system permease protein
MAEPSLTQFLVERTPELMQRLSEHIMLTGVSTVVATIFGMAIAILIFRYQKIKDPVMTFVGMLQTIPSLALLVFLMTLLGKIGLAPALGALTLYALLPIVRNTLLGLESTPPNIIEASVGLGMTNLQQIMLVRLPLAVPTIVAGIRTATVVGVGIATLSAFIGAGGLGEFINRGLALSSSRLILLGAIPSGLLAIILDSIVAAAEWGIRPVRKSDQPLSLPQQRFRRRAAAALPVMAFFAGMIFYVGEHPLAGSAPRVVIGSKHFTEQIILAELMAQTIEKSAHLPVERRFDLGGTPVCHNALIKGEIDLYPEYTGTSLTSILKEPTTSDQKKAFSLVSQQYRDKFQLKWLQPFGFNNSWTILTSSADAKKNNWHTISDISRRSSSLTIGLPAEFAEREDGFAGLKKAYQLDFQKISDIDTNIAYKALAEHELDVAAGNSTDGRIDAYKLTEMRDDKNFFPCYEAAPVIRMQTLTKFPQLESSLSKLSGRITDATMRHLNYAVDGQQRSPAEVVSEFLASRPDILQ